MNTVLVWILITIGEHDIVSYSPPMETLAECQRLSQIVRSTANPSSYYIDRVNRAKCVHMGIVK